MPRLVAVALVLAASCSKAPEESTCDLMCRELVQTCSYQAFPSLESCTQGCTYAGEQGADLEGEYQCITDADCDTFEIVECEHDFGQLPEE